MKFPLRVVAATTLFFFLSQNLGLSAPEIIQIMKPGKEFIRPGINIEIPSALGEIESIHEAPESASLIVHIQDAHGNYEAQKHTAAIIKYLVEKHQFKLLFTEGANEKLNPDLFHFFEDTSLNLKVANTLMRHGEFTGPEMFLLATNENKARPIGAVEGYGIEKTELYSRDLTLFRKIIRFESKKTSRDFFENLKASVNVLESRLFSKELRDFVKEWKSKEEKAYLLRYIDILYKQAQSNLSLDLKDPRTQDQYPALLRVLKLKDLEGKLDEDKIKEEKETILKLLKGRIDDSLYQGLLKLEGKPNDKSGLNPRFLLEKLFADTHKFGFSFKSYPHFSFYATYLIFQNEIESKELFREVDRLTEKIFRVLVKTEEERQLLELIKDISLLEKLFRLELSRTEYRRLLKRKSAIQPSVIAKRIEALKQRKTSGLDGEWDKRFEQALEFYRLAQERESYFLDKTFEIMKAKNQTRAILVTGGFHTEGLKKRMKEKGLAYVQVSPRMNGSENSRDTYFRAMLGQNRKIEKSQIMLAAHLISQQAQLGLLNENSQTARKYLELRNQFLAAALLAYAHNQMQLSRISRKRPELAPHLRPEISSQGTISGGAGLGKKQVIRPGTSAKQPFRVGNGTAIAASLGSVDLKELEKILEELHSRVQKGDIGLGEFDAEVKKFKERTSARFLTITLTATGQKVRDFLEQLRKTLAQKRIGRNSSLAPQNPEEEKALSLLTGDQVAFQFSEANDTSIIVRNLHGTILPYGLVFNAALLNILNSLWKNPSSVLLAYLPGAKEEEAWQWPKTDYFRSFLRMKAKDLIKGYRGNPDEGVIGLVLANSQRERALLDSRRTGIGTYTFIIPVSVFQEIRGTLEENPLLVVKAVKWHFEDNPSIQVASVMRYLSKERAQAHIPGLQEPDTPIPAILSGDGVNKGLDPVIQDDETARKMRSALEEFIGASLGKEEEEKFPRESPLPLRLARIPAGILLSGIESFADILTRWSGGKREGGLKTAFLIGMAVSVGIAGSLFGKWLQDISSVAFSTPLLFAQLGIYLFARAVMSLISGYMAHRAGGKNIGGETIVNFALTRFLTGILFFFIKLSQFQAITSVMPWPMSVAYMILLDHVIQYFMDRLEFRVRRLVYEKGEAEFRQESREKFWSVLRVHSAIWSLLNLFIYSVDPKYALLVPILSTFGSFLVGTVRAYLLDVWKLGETSISERPLRRYGILAGGIFSAALSLATFLGGSLYHWRGGNEALLPYLFIPSVLAFSAALGLYEIWQSTQDRKTRAARPPVVSPNSRRLAKIAENHLEAVLVRPTEWTDWPLVKIQVASGDPAEKKLALDALADIGRDYGSNFKLVDQERKKEPWTQGEWIVVRDMELAAFLAYQDSYRWPKAAAASSLGRNLAEFVQPDKLGTTTPGHAQPQGGDNPLRFTLGTAENHRGASLGENQKSKMKVKNWDQIVEKIDEWDREGIEIKRVEILGGREKGEEGEESWRSGNEVIDLSPLGNDPASIDFRISPGSRIREILEGTIDLEFSFEIWVEQKQEGAVLFFSPVPSESEGASLGSESSNRLNRFLRRLERYQVAIQYGVITPLGWGIIGILSLLASRNVLPLFMPGLVLTAVGLTAASFWFTRIFFAPVRKKGSIFIRMFQTLRWMNITLGTGLLAIMVMNLTPVSWPKLIYLSSHHGFPWIMSFLALFNFIHELVYKIKNAKSAKRIKENEEPPPPDSLIRNIQAWWNGQKTNWLEPLRGAMGRELVPPKPPSAPSHEGGQGASLGAVHERETLSSSQVYGAEAFRRAISFPDADYWDDFETGPLLSAETRRRLKEAVGLLLPSQGRILDVMSGWESVFEKKEGRTVEGLGVSSQLLKRNPLLDSYWAQNLNTDPDIHSEHFYDAAVISFGIPYLTHPLEVLRSIPRLVKPGRDIFIIGSTELYGKEKATAIWLDPELYAGRYGVHDSIDLVKHYLEQAGGFREVQVRNLDMREFLRYSEAVSSFGGFFIISAKVEAQSLGTGEAGRGAEAQATMLFENKGELLEALKDVVELDEHENIQEVKDGTKLKELVWRLYYNFRYSDDSEIKRITRNIARQTAALLGAKPASLADIYQAQAEQKVKFTIPSINPLITLLDTATAILTVAKEQNAGAFQIELTPKQSKLTGTSYDELVTTVSFAAIAAGFNAPLYFKLDHLTITEADVKDGFKKVFKTLEEAIDAGVYNVDIEADSLEEQANIAATIEVGLHARDYGRKAAPGVVITLGAEVEGIGGENTTAEQMDRFISGINAGLEKGGGGRLNVATGQNATAHGGVSDPVTGKRLDVVPFDFPLMREVSAVVRKHGAAGLELHGASTVPVGQYGDFVENGVAEIHLATAWLETVIDFPRKHPDAFEKLILADREAYEQTRSQFMEAYKQSDAYKKAADKHEKTIREALKAIKDDDPRSADAKKVFPDDEAIKAEAGKRAEKDSVRWNILSAHKKIWDDLPETVRDAIREVLRAQFSEVFKSLKVQNTLALSRGAAQPRVVVAGDFTGAFNIALGLKTSYGTEAIVIDDLSLLEQNRIPEGFAVVLNSKAAAFSEDEARRRNAAIVAALKPSGKVPDIKIDYAIRAVQHDLAGLYDQFDYDLMFFVPAMPNLGTKTEGGTHFIRQDEKWIPVHMSEMAKQSPKPMTTSKIDELIHLEFGISQDKILLIPLEVVAQGPAEILGFIAAHQPVKGTVIIPDIAGNEHLDFVAQAVKALEKGASGAPQKILRVGASDFLRALMGKKTNEIPQAKPFAPLDRPGAPVALIGTTNGVTNQQIQLAKEKLGDRLVILELNVDSVIKGDESLRQEFLRLRALILKALDEGRSPLVLQTSREFKDLPHEKSLLVSRKLVELMQDDSILSKVTAFFVSGGETFGMLSETLSPLGVKVEGELSRRVSWGIFYGGRADGIPVVTKQGGHALDPAVIFKFFEAQPIEGKRSAESMSLSAEAQPEAKSPGSGPITKTFSFRDVLRQWDEMKRQPDFIYDTVIVGGGAAGSGALRDLASRGNASAVLVERGNFAEETSSKTGKTIHPGLWYLRMAWHHLLLAFKLRRDPKNKLSFFQNLHAFWDNLLLVWGGTRERKLLIKTSRGVVQPIPFNALVYEDSPDRKWQVFFGIFLYEIFSWLHGGKYGRTKVYWTAAQVAKALPFINQEKLLGAVQYWDGKASNDKTLVVKAIRDAYYRSASEYPIRALAHVELKNYQWREGTDGKEGYFEATLRSHFPNGPPEEMVVKARTLTNAAGPWMDHVRQRTAAADQKTTIEFVRGSQIEVTNRFLDEQLRRNPDLQVSLAPLSAKRRYFFRPYFDNGIWYMRFGSTDRPHQNLADIRPTEEEIQELMDAYNQIVADPNWKITRDDIYLAEAAVRPLVKPEKGTEALGDLSRFFKIDESTQGSGKIFQMIGVKLTEFRWAGHELGEHLKAELERKGIKTLGSSETHRLPFLETAGEEPFALNSLEYRREDPEFLKKRIEHLVHFQMLTNFKDYLLYYGGLRDVLTFDERGKPKIDEEKMRRAHKTMGDLLSWDESKRQNEWEAFQKTYQRNMEAVPHAAEGASLGDLDPLRKEIQSIIGVELTDDQLKKLLALNPASDSFHASLNKLFQGGTSILTRKQKPSLKGKWGEQVAGALKRFKTPKEGPVEIQTTKQKFGLYAQQYHIRWLELNHVPADEIQQYRVTMEGVIGRYREIDAPVPGYEPYLTEEEIRQLVKIVQEQGFGFLFQDGLTYARSTHLEGNRVSHPILVTQNYVLNQQTGVIRMRPEIILPDAPSDAQAKEVYERNLNQDIYPSMVMRGPSGQEVDIRQLGWPASLVRQFEMSLESIGRRSIPPQGSESAKKYFRTLFFHEIGEAIYHVIPETLRAEGHQIFTTAGTRPAPGIVYVKDQIKGLGQRQVAIETAAAGVTVQMGKAEEEFFADYFAMAFYPQNVYALQGETFKAAWRDYFAKVKRHLIAKHQSGINAWQIVDAAIQEEVMRGPVIVEPNAISQALQQGASLGREKPAGDRRASLGIERGKIRVLLLGNDPGLRTYARTLREAGYDVRRKTFFDEAQVEVTEGFVPHVVVVDQNAAQSEYKPALLQDIAQKSALGKLVEVSLANSNQSVQQFDQLVQAQLPELFSLEEAGSIPTKFNISPAMLETWRKQSYPFKEIGEDLYTQFLDGSRPAEVTYDQEIYSLLSKLPPEWGILDKVQRIIAEYPKYWRAGDSDGEVGSAPQKRTVKIVFPEPIKIQGELVEELEISGILFKENEVPHYFRPGSSRAHRRGLGLRSLQEQVSGVIQVEFDEQGIPLLSPTPYAQLGGHGAATAQRKFNNARTHLPKAGYRGPIAVGFGRYLEPKLNISGKRLGFFISAKRKSEPKRLAERVEDVVRLFADQILPNLQKLDQRGVTPGLVRDIAAFQQGRESEGDPFRRVDITHFLTELRDQFNLSSLYEGYGMLLFEITRRFFPKDPHIGNLMADLTGKRAPTWFDLGGYRFREHMTPEQAFAYRYKVISYAMLDIESSLVSQPMDKAESIHPLLHEKNPGRWAYDMGFMDAYHDFLRGFFYLWRNDPDFDLEEFGIDASRKTNIEFYMTKQDSRPLHLREELPFAKLLRKIEEQEYGKKLSDTYTPRDTHEVPFTREQPSDDFFARLSQTAETQNTFDEIIALENGRKLRLIGKTHAGVHIAGKTYPDEELLVKTQTLEKGVSGGALDVEIFTVPESAEASAAPIGRYLGNFVTAPDPLLRDFHLDLDKYYPRDEVASRLMKVVTAHLPQEIEVWESEIEDYESIAAMIREGLPFYDTLADMGGKLRNLLAAPDIFIKRSIKKEQFEQSLLMHLFHKGDDAQRRFTSKFLSENTLLGRRMKEQGFTELSVYILVRPHPEKFTDGIPVLMIQGSKPFRRPEAASFSRSTVAPAGQSPSESEGASLGMADSMKAKLSARIQLGKQFDKKVAGVKRDALLAELLAKLNLNRDSVRAAFKKAGWPSLSNDNADSVIKAVSDVKADAIREAAGWDQIREIIGDSEVSKIVSGLKNLRARLADMKFLMSLYEDVSEIDRAKNTMVSQFRLKKDPVPAALAEGFSEPVRKAVIEKLGLQEKVFNLLYSGVTLPGIVHIQEKPPLMQPEAARALVGNIVRGLSAAGVDLGSEALRRLDQAMSPQARAQSRLEKARAFNRTDFEKFFMSGARFKIDFVALHDAMNGIIRTLDPKADLTPTLEEKIEMIYRFHIVAYGELTDQYKDELWNDKEGKFVYTITRLEDVLKTMELLKEILKPGARFADLGSGDGLVVHLVRLLTGADTTGFDIKNFLIEKAKAVTHELVGRGVLADESGMEWKHLDYESDEADLSPFDVLYIYPPKRGAPIPDKGGEGAEEAGEEAAQGASGRVTRVRIPEPVAGEPTVDFLKIAKKMKPGALLFVHGVEPAKIMALNHIPDYLEYVPQLRAFRKKESVSSGSSLGTAPQWTSGDESLRQEVAQQLVTLREALGSSAIVFVHRLGLEGVEAYAEYMNAYVDYLKMKKSPSAKLVADNLRILEKVIQSMNRLYKRHPVPTDRTLLLAPSAILVVERSIVENRSVVRKGNDVSIPPLTKSNAPAWLIDHQKLALHTDEHFYPVSVENADAALKLYFDIQRGASLGHMAGALFPKLTRAPELEPLLPSREAILYHAEFALESEPGYFGITGLPGKIAGHYIRLAHPDARQAKPDTARNLYFVPFLHKIPTSGTLPLVAFHPSGMDLLGPETPEFEAIAGGERGPAYFLEHIDRAHPQKSFWSQNPNSEWIAWLQSSGVHYIETRRYGVAVNYTQDYIYVQINQAAFFRVPRTGPFDIQLLRGPTAAQPQLPLHWMSTNTPALLQGGQLSAVESRGYFGTQFQTILTLLLRDLGVPIPVGGTGLSTAQLRNLPPASGQGASLGAADANRAEVRLTAKMVIVRDGDRNDQYFNLSFAPNGKNLLARRVARGTDTSRFHPSDIVILRPENPEEPDGVNFSFAGEEDAVVRAAEDPRVMQVAGRWFMTYVRPEPRAEGSFAWHSEMAEIDMEGRLLPGATPIRLGRRTVFNKNAFLTSLPDGRLVYIERSEQKVQGKRAIQFYYFKDFKHFEEVMKDASSPYWDEFPVESATKIRTPEGYSHIGFNTLLYLPGRPHPLALLHLARIEGDKKIYETAAVSLDPSDLTPIGEPALIHTKEEISQKGGLPVQGIIYTTTAKFVGKQVIFYAGIDDTKIYRIEQPVEDLLMRIEPGDYSEVKENGAFRIVIKPAQPHVFYQLATAGHDGANQIVVEAVTKITKLNRQIEQQTGIRGIAQGMPQVLAMGRNPADETLWAAYEGLVGARDLRSEPWLSLSVVRKMEGLIKVAEFLKRMHALGWVHNRILPENIRINAKGEVMVINFFSAELKEDPSSDIEDFGKTLQDLFEGKADLEASGLRSLISAMTQPGPEKRMTMQEVIERLAAVKTFFARAEGQSLPPSGTAKSLGSDQGWRQALVEPIGRDQLLKKIETHLKKNEAGPTIRLLREEAKWSIVPLLRFRRNIKRKNRPGFQPRRLKPSCAASLGAGKGSDALLGFDFNKPVVLRTMAALVVVFFGLSLVYGKIVLSQVNPLGYATTLFTWANLFMFVLLGGQTSRTFYRLWKHGKLSWGYALGKIKRRLFNPFQGFFTRKELRVYKQLKRSDKFLILVNAIFGQFIGTVSFMYGMSTAIEPQVFALIAAAGYGIGYGLGTWVFGTHYKIESDRFRKNHAVGIFLGLIGVLLALADLGGALSGTAILQAFLSPGGLFAILSAVSGGIAQPLIQRYIIGVSNRDRPELQKHLPFFMAKFGYLFGWTTWMGIVYGTGFLGLGFLLPGRMAQDAADLFARGSFGFFESHPLIWQLALIFSIRWVIIYLLNKSKKISFSEIVLMHAVTPLSTALWSVPILGKVITLRQNLAGLMILLGSWMVSWKLEGNNKAERRSFPEFDDTPHPVFITSYESPAKPETQKIIYVNKVFLQMVGGQESDWIGKTYLEKNPPDLAQKYTQDDLKAMEKPRGEYFHETELNQSGEKPVLVETVKLPFYDAQGKWVGVLGMFTATEGEKPSEEMNPLLRATLTQVQQNQKSSGEASRAEGASLGRVRLAEIGDMAKKNMGALFRLSMYLFATQLGYHGYVADGFSDSDARIRRIVLNLINRMHNPELKIDGYIRALRNKNPQVSIEAIKALEKLQATRALDALMDKFYDYDFHVRKALVRAIGKLGNHDTVSKPSTLIREKSYLPYVVISAAHALAHLGRRPELKPVAVGVLNAVLFLPQSEPYFRQTIAKLLGELGDRSAIEPLKKVLADSTEAVRGEARRALEKLGVPAAGAEKWADEANPGKQVDSLFLKRLEATTRKLSNGRLENTVENGVLKIFRPRDFSDWAGEGSDEIKNIPGGYPYARLNVRAQVPVSFRIKLYGTEKTVRVESKDWISVEIPIDTNKTLGYFAISDVALLSGDIQPAADKPLLELTRFELSNKPIPAEGSSLGAASNLGDQWPKRHRLAFDALKKYFPQGFRGTKGLELGYTASYNDLLEFLKSEGAEMYGVGLEAPGDQSHLGIHRREISEFLKGQSMQLDFIYAPWVLETDSLQEGMTLKHLKRILARLLQNLKPGGILVIVNNIAPGKDPRQLFPEAGEIEKLGFELKETETLKSDDQDMEMVGFQRISVFQKPAPIAGSSLGVVEIREQIVELLRQSRLDVLQAGDAGQNILAADQNLLNQKRAGIVGALAVALMAQNVYYDGETPEVREVMRNLLGLEGLEKVKPAITEEELLQVLQEKGIGAGNFSFWKKLFLEENKEPGVNIIPVSSELKTDELQEVLRAVQPVILRSLNKILVLAYEGEVSQELRDWVEKNFESGSVFLFSQVNIHQGYQVFLDKLSGQSAFTRDSINHVLANSFRSRFQEIFHEGRLNTYKLFNRSQLYGNAGLFDQLQLNTPRRFEDNLAGLSPKNKLIAQMTLGIPISGHEAAALLNQPLDYLIVKGGASGLRITFDPAQSDAIAVLTEAMKALQILSKAA